MAKCQEAWDQMEVAKKPHVDALRKMEADIAAFLNRIKTIEVEMVIKSKAIAEGEKELGALLIVANRRIRSFYIRSSNINLLASLLTSSDIGATLRNYGYQQAITNEDKRVITQTAVMVKDLEDKKKKLEGERATLAAMKEDVDKRAVSVRKLVADANAYEAQLSSTIASLSAKQQAFLGAKLAGLGIPLYAMSGGGCSSDLTNGKDPGFSGGFGFFTFGVPNRVGLNQYGAWGRAKQNQDYDTILKAYYSFDSIERRDATINVQGYQGYSLDDYVKRVYEVPASWTDHESAALKAQAIAIRSYALAYTNNGQGSICTTQQCQVFKPEPKTDNNNAWINAVDATAGLVMIQGGNPIKAFFSSTHGGYVFNTGDLSGWTQTPYTKRVVDTTSGSVSSFSDLKNTAYDKDSPWFYCDWGGRSSAGGTAWLRPEEVADIINVMLLAKADGGTQSHLVQTDKTNPDGTDTWDAGRVRSELSSRGVTPYNSVSNISVSADFGIGRVTSVNVSGDGKSNSFAGDEFKTYFNLRAPANIQIVGPLFNVERK
ncbi:MAG: SpoIID/LytB domain-containing protein [Microgenomates group bacterium]